MKIFSIPLNPKLTEEEFGRFYELVKTYKDYIYDIYFTSRVPPFIQDAMGDAFDPLQAQDLIHNAMIFQEQFGIPLSATFNNIEVPPVEELLDVWIQHFRPLYDKGIRTVTLPHTIWMLSGKIQKAFPDLFVKNTILRNVQRPNEIVKLVEAGFSYINLDRDLMRDRDALLEIKRAKEYCIKKYGRDIKISLLANEGCWGNCPVQDEHFQFNNNRRGPMYPTYFMTNLSKSTCPSWDRDDPGEMFKKANFPPWREDWMEFLDLGIDVFKMHGREHAPRLFETMEIIKNFAEGKEILWNNFQEYTKDLKVEGSPINAWRKKIKNCKFNCWDCNYCEDVVVSKSKNRFVDQINTALRNADAGVSNVSQQTLSITGLTSNKIKHFVNNLVSLPDARYAEIGCFQGAIFTSAIQGNNHAGAVAIENFASPNIEPMREIDDWIPQTGSTKDILLANVSNIMHPTAKVIDKDAFAVTLDDVKFKINILFYDGDHSFESQEKVIAHYKPLCDEIFILIVDDWNWPQVKDGTYSGIKNAGLKVKFEKSIETTGEDPADYWNGLGIFVLEK